jgi:hypothetical protein
MGDDEEEGTKGYILLWRTGRMVVPQRGTSSVGDVVGRAVVRVRRERKVVAREFEVYILSVEALGWS